VGGNQITRAAVPESAAVTLPDTLKATSGRSAEALIGGTGGAKTLDPSQEHLSDHVLDVKDSLVENKAQLAVPQITVPNKRLFGVFVVFSLVAVFYLPYFAPVPPSASESYIFGYSNRLGVLLLLLLTALGAIWTKSLNLTFISNENSEKVPLKYLCSFLVIESAGCAAMYWSVRRIGGVSEAAYEVQRIWLLSRGEIPQIDFEWAYGPGLIYVPLWICKFLHLSIPDAYYLFWAIASLVGIILLYITINLIDYPTRKRAEIFLLFGISWLLCIPSLGVSYSGLRFVTPLLFILLIYKVSRNEGRIAYAGACVLAPIFTAALFLISPETAIALACASSIVLYLEMPIKPGGWSNLSYFISLASLAFVIIVSYKLHVLDSVIFAGGGADSLPVIFAPVTVLYFAASFICACYLFRRIRRNGPRDNTVAIVIFSIPMTVAALSRCDPTHILGNGLGIILATFFYASGFPRMWKIYRNAFITCFIVLNGLAAGVLFLIFRAGPSLPVLPERADLTLIYRESGGLRSDGIFEAPFGYRPNRGGVYLSPQIDYGYYDELVNAGSPDAIRRKIDQLAQHPQRGVLLTNNFTNLCSTYPGTERVFLSVLLASPYLARPAHTQSIREPLCDYILTHYVLAEPATPGTFQYALWTPKD
jgi:hypothetical protein